MNGDDANNRPPDRQKWNGVERRKPRKSAAPPVYNPAPKNAATRLLDRLWMRFIGRKKYNNPDVICKEFPE